MIFTLHNQGGPKAVYTASGKLQFIKPDETVQIDISEDTARVIARRDGSLQLKLTEEQAQLINMPPEAKPAPTEDAAPGEIPIISAWADLPWKDRRKLAKAICGQPVMSGGEAAAVIEGELKRRKEAKNGLHRSNR